MNEKGLPEDQVIEELDATLVKDLTFDSGKILGSMGRSAHGIAQRVYHKSLEKNVGDPELFPATTQLEREAIQLLGSLLSNPDARGSIVTGGTEANLLARARHST